MLNIGGKKMMKFIETNFRSERIIVEITGTISGHRKFGISIKMLTFRRILLNVS